MKKYTQFIAENKSRTFDTRYYYAVYTDSRLKEITGPYKSEDSAWYDHGGDMDEIHKGDEIQNLMNKGKYKEYTLRLADKPI